MSLGERIANQRKSQGISQELLAENAKVSLRTIQRIEVGDSLPRPYTLKVIADALGVTVEHLNPTNSTNLSNEIELAKLRQINLGGFVAFIPLMNILIPFLIWNKNKHLPFVNALGRRAISFQILWTITATVGLIATRFVQQSISGSVAIGRLPPTIFVVYFLLLVGNFIVVLREAGKLKNETSEFYSFAPVLF